MKKAIILLAALLTTAPVVALAKSGEDSSKSDQGRTEWAAKHLKVVESCSKEKAKGEAAFNDKYEKDAVERISDQKKRLGEIKTKLEESGTSTKKIDRQLKRLDSIEPTPFRTCVRSGTFELMKDSRGDMPGHGPEGMPGPGDMPKPEDMHSDSDRQDHPMSNMMGT